MKIKAITLWNPWAFLVWLAGHPDPEVAKLGKRIETRSWYTSYRGPLAIHAAVTRSHGKAVHHEPFKSVLLQAGINSQDDLPYGAVIAIVNLSDIQGIGKDCLYKYRDDAITGTKIPLPTGNELAFGDYTPGRYAWIFKDVQPLEKPIPAKGRQGLWNWDGDLCHWCAGKGYVETAGGHAGAANCWHCKGTGKEDPVNHERHIPRL